MKFFCFAENCFYLEIGNIIYARIALCPVNTGARFTALTVNKVSGRDINLKDKR